jgi:hypothetical protein
VAVDLKQVEGDEVRLRLDLVPAPQQFEHRKPVLVADHELTVDQTGFDIEPLERLDHGREALAPVGAAACEQADTIAGA